MSPGYLNNAIAASAVLGAAVSFAPGSQAQTRSAGHDSVAVVLPDPATTARFHFTRAVYSNFHRFDSWRVDYPEADRHFLLGLERLTGIDPFDDVNPIRLDDPELRRFPFLYAVEVGYMSLSPAEVSGLRSYLLAGGFLVVDDFWGSSEWAQFANQMDLVLPEFPVEEIPPDHPILSSFYDIDEVIQVPGFGRGVRGIPTWERDGRVPHLRGIFDDDRRLMVVINWNTDLGDAWEHADMAEYPLHYSTFAYRMGINFIIYALTH